MEQVAREAYANGRAALKQRKFSTSSSWFTQACLGRIAAGCYELAVQYENGRGVGRDSGQAKSFFALACDRAHKEACFKEALYYSIGDDERISLFREACDGDVSDACESLGMQFEQGIGVKINELEAMNLYRRSCELGNAGGCSKLGQIVGVGNVQALELFIAGCEGGSVDGCAMLARVYSNGNGVERDLDKARLYYSEACYIRTSSDTLSRDREEINKRERLGPACAWLGQYYSAQEGDHQDYSLAHSYFLAGCKADSPRSCSGLGFLWETGHRDLKKQANDPLQSDVRMAFKYYEQACDLGSEDSCEKVRSSCDEGNGVACTAMADRFLDGGGEALFSKAQLLESACDYGDGLGCARLGEMVEQGSGVRSDPIRALEIMQRGCNLGAPRACDLAKGREFSIKIHREDCSAGDRTACVWLHNSGYLNE
ncbi:MAG: Sel1-like repeat protein HcpE [Henriciella sp.]